MQTADIVQWSAILAATLTTFGNVIIFMISSKRDKIKLAVEFNTKKFFEMKERRKTISIATPIVGELTGKDAGDVVIGLFNSCVEAVRELAPYFNPEVYAESHRLRDFAEFTIMEIGRSGGIDHDNKAWDAIRELALFLDNAINVELLSLGRDLSRA